MFRPHLLLLLFWLPLHAPHAQDAAVQLEDGTEVPLHRFGEGRDRLLWIPAEYGLRGEPHRRIAAAIAGGGLEVWLADLHAAWFLVPGRSSYTEVDPAAIASLIEQARPQDGTLYLMSTGRGAALLLMGAREWRLAHPDAPPLGGAVLLHPNLASDSAKPGQPVSYLPIAGASNLPLYVFQPLNSAKRWHLSGLMDQLQRGGSTVYGQVLPGTSDGFQSRPDATEQELAERERLPARVRAALGALERHNDRARPAVAELPVEWEWKLDTLAAGLQPYPGAPPAPPTRLLDLEGQRVELADYRGRVVLLNFWATWCPPCVEEIPSLGRLQEGLAERGFVVLGVDVGEPPEAVRAFLARVPARYPVLLDPQGAMVGPWELRAFPTTFLVDRQGRVRYSYYGALEWDDPSVVALVEKLLAEEEGAEASGY